MRENDTPPTPELEAPEAPAPSAGSELLLFLFLVRQHWWAVLGAGVIAAGAAWYAASSADPVYTAEVLLQKTASSPLAAAGLAGSHTETLDFGSQLEIIRSRNVLGDAVEPLGLQLRVADRPEDRSRLVPDVQVQPRVEPAAYDLVPDGGRVALRRGESDSTLAAAAPGDWLVGPGFRLRAPDLQALGSAPVRIMLTDRQRALERLQNKLLVEPGKGLDLLHVSYSDPDPLHAAAVVNAVARSYTEFRARVARNEAARRRVFLEGQLAELSDSLRLAQEKLLDYQERERLLDPDMQRDLIVTGLARADDEARDLRFQERVLQSLVDALNSANTNTAGLSRVVALGREVMPGGVELYNRLRELETERNRLTASRFGYTDAGPGVEVVDSLISATRAEIWTLARQNLRFLRERRLEAESRRNEIRQQVREIPQRTTEMARLKQQADAVQNMFDLLLGRYYEAQIAEAIQTGDVDVVDPASVPMRPDPTGRELKAAVGFLGGIMLSLVALGIIHNTDNRVRSRDEAERAARLPIVGLVPHISARARDLAVERLAGVEAFRAIGIHLAYTRPNRPAVIAITSAGPGESKSTVAANLAVAMAKQGSRVLLIDTDLRRPVIHRMFNCKQSPGLTEVIDDSVRTEAAVIHDDLYGLDILTCGAATNNSPSILTSQAFALLLERLRGHYDHVVLDTAPLLAVADSSIVCARADSALLVVRANRTNRTALRRAIELLERADASVIGAVLADIPPTGVYARSMYGYDPYYKFYAGQAGANGAEHTTPRLLQSRA